MEWLSQGSFSSPFGLQTGIWRRRGTPEDTGEAWSGGEVVDI